MRRVSDPWSSNLTSLPTLSNFAFNLGLDATLSHGQELCFWMIMVDVVNMLQDCSCCSVSTLLHGQPSKYQSLLLATYCIQHTGCRALCFGFPSHRCEALPVSQTHAQPLRTFPFCADATTMTLLVVSIQQRQVPPAEWHKL